MAIMSYEAISSPFLWLPSYCSRHVSACLLPANPIRTTPSFTVTSSIAAFLCNSEMKGLPRENKKQIQVCARLVRVSDRTLHSHVHWSFFPPLQQVVSSTTGKFYIRNEQIIKSSLPTKLWSLKCCIWKFVCPKCAVVCNFPPLSPRVVKHIIIISSRSSNVIHPRSLIFIISFSHKGNSSGWMSQM